MILLHRALIMLCDNISFYGESKGRRATKARTVAAAMKPHLPGTTHDREYGMSTLEEVKQIINDVLQLNGRVQSFDRSTGLLGEVPEFDSMAVVSLVTQLEEQFGITVDDEEISAETFETVGSLTDFVDRKLAQ